MWLRNASGQNHAQPDSKTHYITVSAMLTKISQFLLEALQSILYSSYTLKSLYDVSPTLKNYGKIFPEVNGDR